jgi:hypothetical protein
MAREQEVEQVRGEVSPGGSTGTPSVGWHVCKQGTRFAALEPLSQGLMATVSSVAADAGRGLALRLDHGSRYLSDHFQYWGDRTPLHLYRATPDQRRGGTLHSDPQGAGHLWPRIPEPERGERGGPALCGHLQPGVAGGKKWLQKPQPGQGSMAHPGLTRQGGLKKLVSKKPDAVQSSRQACAILP